MKKEYPYVVIGFLAGILVAVLFASSVVNSNNQQMMGMMGMRSYSQSVRNTDVLDAHFIEQMIPHHEDAITMSELALEETSRQEVKELAQNIIDSQSEEIEQMKLWYKDWFGRDLPTGKQVMNVHGMMRSSGMHMGMMGNETDIERLEEAQDFDKEFVEQMIPHHQMAVMMATMLKNGTKRPEMKKLADNIITSQTDEIDMMREWLRNW